MPKNIVICCDGTGNEIKTTISNVLKLFRVLPRDEAQRVYYHPGVGTIGLESPWGRFKQQAYAIRGLATGAGLDEDTLAAYRFLCRAYEKGDKVWLFGFSRGAYTVRVLAALIQVIGLLPPDQIDLAAYALTSYKNASAGSHDAGGNKDFLEEAWHFSHIAGGYHVPLEFVGVWDTVASVIVPRQDKFWFDLQTLVYTRTNPSVKKFRQAIAIDERRRMFRLNRWTQPQKYRPDIFDASNAMDQDIRQVWFAGVHGDVGGGYPETESGPSKFPLLWMIDQAVAAGLRVDQEMVNHLCSASRRPGDGQSSLLGRSRKNGGSGRSAFRRSASTCHAANRASFRKAPSFINPCSIGSRRSPPTGRSTCRRNMRPSRIQFRPRPSPSPR